MGKVEGIVLLEGNRIIGSIRLRGEGGVRAVFTSTLSYTVHSYTYPSLCIIAPDIPFLRVFLSVAMHTPNT